MQETSAALIDQLVYIDNFTMNQDTPNMDVDGQLSLDLAAFADDSFIFADEEKPDPPNDDDNNDDFQNADHDKPDPLPVSFQDLPSANNPLEDNWFHHEDMMSMPQEDANGHDILMAVADGDTHGHQLTSTLNDKIQSMKRSKIQSHNVHDHNDINQFSHRDSAAGHDQNNVFGRNPHLGSLDPDHDPDHGHTHGNGNGQDSHTSLQALNRASVSVPNLSGSQMHNPRANSTSDGIPDLSGLPKFPVPPGAESSLKRAGLSQNQIDLLSALIAQHQTTLAAAPGTSANGRQPQVPALHRTGSGLPINTNPRQVTEVTVKSEPKDVSSFRSNINSPASNYSSENSSVSSSVMGSQSHTSDNYSNMDLPTPNVDSEKRRRNTAASARFRVKKKMKEKDMEEKIKQLTKAVKSFEIKIDDLEMENRLLKGLIIEKGNRESDEELKKLKDRAKFIND